MSDMGHEYMPLAIVGMSCRLPGATNLEEFWNLIASAGDATGELPEDVLERELYFDPRKGVRGKSYSAVGGLVPRLAFDNTKCRLPEEILGDYDSSHLTMCEVTSDALRDAGYDPFNVPTPHAGIYIGHTGGSTKGGDVLYSACVEQPASYLHSVAALQSLPESEIDSIASAVVDELRRNRDRRDESPGFDASANRAAELAARAFGLDGPCIVVDAACASSLQALSLGARALQLGEIDMAVVGAASCCKSDSLVLFSQAYSVSAGKSTPFDADADGLVTAEGYIAIVLKTLPRALADGDRIRCLIRGIGMAADGKGKSLWAPRKEGQIIAMQRAYPPSLQPKDIQYIEAHATSTQVGDATELTALADVFPKSLPGARKIPLGSVKANIGHTLEAAGVAGLVKAALAIEHGIIPPVANLKTPNPAVCWEELPFHLPKVAEPWERLVDGMPRRAAVNSFGIGGLNVHVVLEEFLNGGPPMSQVQVGASNSATAAREPIAVIGTGAIVSGACDVEAFWELLVSGRDPRTDVSPERWDPALFYDPTGTRPYRSRGRRGGFITDYHYDWRRHRVPPKQVANANPLQFMLLTATEEAIRRAGYLDRDFDRDRVGVMVGTIFGGDFSTQLQVGLRLPEFARSLRRQLSGRGVADSLIDQALEQCEEILLANMPALLDETGSFTSSTLASRITKTFNLKGGALAMDAGNGTGLAVIGACIDALRCRDCDMMICAAGQRNMDITVFESMTRSGYLPPGEPYPMYDARSQGFVPGEGCGVLVLKRLSDAQRDGDSVLAVLHGVAASTQWKEKGQALRRALQRALESGRVLPAEIGAIEAVGMLPDLARAEVEVFADMLAKENRPQPVTLNSIVSQFGHMGATHAMASTIKAVLSVDRKELPAGLVTTEPGEDLAFSRSIQLQKNSLPLNPESASTVGVSCGSEYGTAYHLLVEHPDRAIARANRLAAEPSMVSSVQDDYRIVRIGAENWDSLIQLLDTGPLEPLYRPEREFVPTDHARVAMVCSQPDEFADKCKIAAKQLADRTRPTRDRLGSEGIYFGRPQLISGGATFVFSGQGSQYAGMLSQLIAELPEARAACRRVDAAMEALGYESFTDIAGPDAQGVGTDIWKTQIAMLLADTITEDTLRQLGLRPWLVAGHSYGEYPALVSAGGWSLTDAIRCTRLRYRSIVETPRVEGCMAATNADTDLLQRCFATVGEGIHIANLNAPDQTIIAGRRVAVEQAVQWLKLAGCTAVVIKVPCPFHTPLMADASRRFIELVPEIALRDGVVPLVSTATSQTIRYGEEFLGSLTAQLTTSVNYRAMLDTILAQKPALVVEVGPQQVLTRLNKKNCPADDTVFIASDVRRRAGARSLLGVIAQAECLGCIEADQSRRPRYHGSTGANADRILVYDATQRRTNKKRGQAQAAAARSASASAAGDNGSRTAKQAVLATTASTAASTPRRQQDPVPTEQKKRFAGTTDFNFESAGATAASTETRDLASPPTAPKMQVSEPVLGGAANPATSNACDRDELQRILVGFVVEQTGYPEEIVELDADLEADLGIDSIKKAQLFGEVGEQFQIAPRDDMSLDDFPTLGHVLTFLVAELGAGDNDSTASPLEEQVTTSGGPAAAVPTRLAIQSAVALPETVVPAGSESVSATSCVDPDQLRQILVGFVVEQTGYPEEIIEMDADLEADLGIDSIKKAQLFGEVGEQFQIAPRDDMSLDDFPTLGHVLAFLVQELGTSNDGASVSPVEQQTVTPAPSTTEPAMASSAEPTEAAAAPQSDAAPTTSAVDPEELRQILVGFVIEQTGYPEEIIEMDADLEADLGIDSIKKAQLFGEVGEQFQIAPRDDLSLDDFPTLGHVLTFLVEELAAGDNGSLASPADEQTIAAVTGPAVPPALADDQSLSKTVDKTPPGLSGSPSTSHAVDVTDLRQKLIDFVVEQTGYPRELIDMDADLDGDLGIDAGKMPYFFTNLSKRFHVVRCGDGLSAGSVTLGQVLDALVRELAFREDGGGASGVTARDAVEETPLRQDASSVPPTKSAGGDEFVCVQVLQGAPREMGRQHGSQLRDAIRRQLARLADTPRSKGSNGVTTWPAPWSEEISGIADGAQVNRDAVSLLNQSSQPISLLRTSFTGETSAPRQPADRDAITLVQVRNPSDAIRYLTIGAAGQLSVPVAINARQLAVSSEPLDSAVSVDDIIAVTTTIHQIAATSRSVTEVESHLAALKLQSRWSFGASAAGRSQAIFWRYEAGALGRCDHPVSGQQAALHQTHMGDPSGLVLVDRYSGREHRILLSELLGDPQGSVTQTAGADEAPAAKTVMRRHVLRMSPATRPSTTTSTYREGDLVYLVGDASHRSALRRQLGQCRIEESGSGDALDDLRHQLSREVPRHLVLLTEAENCGANWREFQAASRLGEPLEICRLWLEVLEENKAIEGASLASITRMGGDFGFHSSCENCAGGGLTGLLKGIRREFPALRVKALDFDRASAPSQIVSELIDEMNSADADLEVGFRGGQRYLVQAVARVAPRNGPRDISPGGVWVVTGGGRGVTSVVARELGRRFDLRLHLLGTAPLPAADAPWRGLDEGQRRELKRDTAIRARQDGRNPAEEWGRIEKAMELDWNLRQFADAGVQATYHACDIGDLEKLAVTLQSIRRSDGPLQGVLHGAGIELSCRFSRKKHDVVQATIASKCDGAANLIALTSGDPLQYFVAFGSTSGRFGGLGQADYSLASDLLAKMTDRLATERPACKSVCFHWPAWDDVGMAVRPESKMALKTGGLTFMPSSEGVAHVVAELQSGAGEREILILDKPEPLDTDGTMSRPSVPAAPDTFRNEARNVAGEVPGQASNCAIEAASNVSDDNGTRMPLIDSISPGSDRGVSVAVMRLHAGRDPFLAEHQFRKKPIMPVVMTVEMFVEAVSALKAPARVTAVRDVQIINGFVFAANRECPVKIRLIESPAGVKCELVGPFFNSRGEIVESDRLYASGMVEFGEKSLQLETMEPGAPTFAWFPFYYPKDFQISHGEPFQTLVKIDFIHAGGRAVLKGRPRDELIGERPGEGMLTGAAVLDGALVACGAWGYAMLEKCLEIPDAIGCYRQARLPRDGEECVLRFFLRDHHPEHNTYDFVLIGDSGDTILQVEGYRAIRVAENS